MCLSTFQLKAKKEIHRARERKRKERIRVKMQEKIKNMKNLLLDEYNNIDKETSTTGRTATPRLQAPKRDQAQTTPNVRGNRFGFRQNVVRPATGIMPKFNDFDSVNNNNLASSVNDKRRSKSATAATRTNVTIAQPTVKTVNEEQLHTNAK